ncbi:MAG: hypothetical protein ACP5RI_03640 [Candidatus Micrarchaeia archaeon]
MNIDIEKNLKMNEKVTGGIRYIFDIDVDPKIIDMVIENVRNKQSELLNNFSKEEKKKLLNERMEIYKYEEEGINKIKISSRIFRKEDMEGEIGKKVKDEIIKLAKEVVNQINANNASNLIKY